MCAPLSDGVVWGERLRNVPQTSAGVQVYIRAHINPIKTLRKFEVVKISFQRWKAMMMDREETEEEVYMPTDKVFGL